MANRKVIAEFVKNEPETAKAMIGLHARLASVISRWIIIGSFWGHEVECKDCEEEANKIRVAAKGETVRQWQIDRLRVLSCGECRKRLP
tara:strand:+ start:590 stop:856 length:267 start_codon:yes stop_codon:yes gene_type:complete